MQHTLTTLEKMLLQELMRKREEVVKPVNEQINVMLGEVASRLDIKPEDMSIDLSTMIVTIPDPVEEPVEE